MKASVVSIVLISFSLVLAGPVDNIQPGTWYEAPNTHMRAVDPCPQRQQGGGSCSWSGTGGQAAILKAWGGAAYDDTRDRLIVWGGGHGDYGGNEVYVFDVNTLTWIRVTDPSDPPARDTPYASDGAPGSSHSRNTLQYVPALNAMCIFGFSGYFPSAGVGSSNTDCYDFTNNEWVYKANVPSGGSGRGFTTLDAYGFVYSHGEGTAGKLTRFNPYTNTWTSHVKNPWGWFPYAGTGAIDPQTRKLYAAGGGKLLQWDLDNPDARLVELSTSGSSSILSPKYPGFVWHPSGNFAAWSGGKTVYLLDPETNHWTTATGSGPDPGSAVSTGTYGRFRYIKSKDVFILLNGVDMNVFFYKLPAQYTIEELRLASSRGNVVTVWPNPFHSNVNIRIQCKVQNAKFKMQNSRFKIFDLKGKLLVDLSDKTRNQFTWNSIGNAPGMYIAKVKMGNKTFTKRLILMR